MASALSIFKNLSGEWLLQRTVLHFGIMSGKAIFKINSENHNEYDYLEKGTITLLAGTTTIFFREYIFCYDPGKEAISLFYKEDPKRFFYQLNFNHDFSEARGAHLCNADQYDAHYHFIDNTKFTLKYTIKGPQKDTEIHTTYTRT